MAKPKYFKNDEQRMVFSAQLHEIRKRQLRKFGPWDPVFYGKQVSKAIKRYGTTSQTGLTDRGANPTDVPASVLADAEVAAANYGMAPLYGKAIAKGQEVAARYPLEYGAVYPVGFRNLHPHAELWVGYEIWGEGSTEDEEHSVFWYPYDINRQGQTNFVGSDLASFGTTLSKLAKTYGVVDYVQEYRNREAEARAIVAQRILHTIGTAVLAAFPATAAFAPAAYAAGNAAIDIQATALSDDPQWADTFDSINSAVAEFMKLGEGEPPKNLNAQSTEQGVVWDMDWSDAAQLGYDATIAIAEATQGGYDGQAEQIIATLDDYGIYLPDDLAAELVSEVSLITGYEPPKTFNRGKTWKAGDTISKGAAKEPGALAPVLGVDLSGLGGMARSIGAGTYTAGTYAETETETETETTDGTTDGTTDAAGSGSSVFWLIALAIGAAFLVI